MTKHLNSRYTILLLVGQTDSYFVDSMMINEIRSFDAYSKKLKMLDVRDCEAQRGTDYQVLHFRVNSETF